jgi:hypothetical protein
MRLISPFKDHYDAFLRDGDTSTTWERKTSVVTEPPPGPEADLVKKQRLMKWKDAVAMHEEFPDCGTVRFKLNPYWTYETEMRVMPIVISIAGKLKLFLTIYENRFYNKSLDYSPCWCGTYDEAIVKFEELARLLVKNRSSPKSESRHFVRNYTFATEKFVFSEKGLSAWEVKWGNATSTIESHVACSAPLYLSHGGIIVANPLLSDFGVYRHIDAYTVAQEIEVYLNNELAMQRDPIPKRTDDLIRDAHGFDKNSFRNTKPDRRTRKSR